MTNNDFHDFKPIISEIEDRPPNPLGLFFLWTILSLITVALLVLYFVKVDVVVTARGKVIPFGDVKVMQPLETGVVTAIHVKEGDYVKKGRELLEIDASIDLAELASKKNRLKSTQLAIERILALLHQTPFPPLQHDDIPKETIESEIGHYNAQKKNYQSTLNEKTKEIQEVKSERVRLESELTSLEMILKITTTEEKRLKALVDIGMIAENRYHEKVKEKIELEKEINTHKNQVKQLLLERDKIKIEIQTFTSGFQDKLYSELFSNMQDKKTLEAEIAGITFKQGKRHILSPVDGFIHVLQVKTIGGVVTTAQPVVTIVPENTPMIVIATVQNKDIGYVKEAQHCVIKIDTFDFQKYGTIEGIVDNINPYNVEEKDQGVDSEQTQGPGGFPIFFEMLANTLNTRDGTIYHIKPGMTATVEIKVGTRRVIEFFLFPIIRYLDEGLKVR